MPQSMEIFAWLFKLKVGGGGGFPHWEVIGGSCWMQKQFIITAVPGHQNPAAGFSKFLQQAYTYPPTILLHTYLPTYLFATFAVTCYVYTYQPTQKRFITAMPDNQKLATSLLKSL